MTSPTRRAAAIDIGTNSVLLTVVEGGSHESLRQGLGGRPAPFAIVEERCTVTRLGQGVDSSRRLHPDAVRRTLACLSEYAHVLSTWDMPKLLVVGTSALRDAAGSEDFLHAACELLGTNVEVISGAREAELTFRGALLGLDFGARGEPEWVAAFDIGGGSTELILGRPSGELVHFESLDLGTVRLTERLRPADRPTPADLERIDHAIETALAESSFFENAARALTDELVVAGIAGTVTSLWAVTENCVPYDPERADGAVLESARLAETVELISQSSLASRLALPSLEPGRADVIVVGARLTRALVAHFGVSEIRVIDRGVRHGLLLEHFDASP